MDAGPPAQLDPAQAQAVAHRPGSGPLVILGAPGTGKTTTLVEAVVARVGDGVPPDGVLVLAPTRTVATGLRDRLSARLARTIREPLSRTPHSYAYGLLRRTRVLEGDVPPRLLSGPEQDRVLADLLAGHEAGDVPGPRWPDAVTSEIRALRGFREELRDLLMRAVERGLGPLELAVLGQRHARPDWVSAARILEEYLEVTSLATPGAYDPAGIVDAAARLLEDDAGLLAAERERWTLVAVDDAQELTVAAERLLGLLAGGGRDLLLAGDPDCATQAFRGARPRVLGEAADRFRTVSGGPAHVVVLSEVHRHGAALRSVAARVAERIGSAGVVAHRSVPLPSSAHGSHEVRVLASPAQEAAYVAQWLRRHHLDGGVPWGRMAVVVRSARGTEALRRTLGAVGVPVAVPTAEVPVRDEPAVVPLRLALRCSLDPTALTPELAVQLLTGPLGGADALMLRRLRQALRAEELIGQGTRTSDELLVDALGGPERVVTLEPRVAAPARRVATVLAAGRDAVAAPGATAEAVLWALWDTARLGEGWRRTALGGGPAGARADRDLDAVVALFDAAARYVDRLPLAGPAAFLEYLEGQELPADTLAERAPDTEAVSLVTAQGAAGREWDVVAVTGVQEGQWPDLRLRSSLLGAQLLADVADGRVTGDLTGEVGETAAASTFPAQRKAVLDDELRIFLVAVSRARHRLLVTAVRSDHLLPSPFLDLVDPDGSAEEVRPLAAVPRTMTLPSLVAELRSVVVDRDVDSRRRHAAAGELARLADAGVPGADPEDWYGLGEVTGTGPLRPDGTPVRVSPSKVESYDRCALRWLLEQAGGRAPSSTAQGLGTLVHELAEEVPDGDPERLRALLDERFPRLGLGAGWVADRERERAGRMVTRLAAYVASARAAGRELIAVERNVRVQVGRADVHGQVDRLERDAEGRLVVVDLKTGRGKPTQSELERHAQLGVYQLAVEAGGFEDVAPGQRESGGAILVQLGAPGGARTASLQEQAPLSRDDDPQWARRLVETVADGMAGESFPATSNVLCRMCDLRRSCPLQVEGRQVGR